MCSRTEVVVRGSFTFPVNAAVVEETFRDVQASPSFVPELLSLEFTKGEPWTVGSSWNERRLFAGREVVIRKTITRISEDPFTVNVHVDHPKTDHCCSPKADGTFTMVIEPGHKEGMCVHNWTMAFVTGGVGKIISLLFLPCLKKSLCEMVNNENERYAVEAVRREQLIIEKRLQTSNSGDAEMD